MYIYKELNRYTTATKNYIIRKAEAGGKLKQFLLDFEPKSLDKSLSKTQFLYYVMGLCAWKENYTWRTRIKLHGRLLDDSFQLYRLTCGLQEKQAKQTIDLAVHFWTPMKVMCNPTVTFENSFQNHQIVYTILARSCVTSGYIFLQMRCWRGHQIIPTRRKMEEI